MRDMKDSGIYYLGAIPKGWEVQKYKNFSKCRMGETILAEDTEKEGIPIYSATQEDKIFGYTSKAKFILSKGDIVIPARGNSIGCATLVKEETATCTQTTIGSYDINNINNEFDYYTILGLKDEWFKYDGSAIPQITVEQVKNNKLAIPPIKEQKMIADYLGKKVKEINNIIKKTKKTIEDYKRYRQLIITKAVTKGTDKNANLEETNFLYAKKILAGSRIVKMSKIVTTSITDGTHSTPNYSDKDNGSPFLSSKDVTKGCIDWENIKYITKELHQVLYKTTKPQKDDILLAKNGTTGVAALVEDDRIFDIYVTLALIRPNKEIVLPKYLLYAINSDISKKQFNEHLLGIGVPNLHLNVINDTKIIVHNLREQENIVNYLDKKCNEIDNLINRKERLIAELEKYKKSLIYECVTGKKEVI